MNVEQKLHKKENRVLNGAVILIIVGILVYILGPVFERAKEPVHKPSCQSNLKELSTAVSLYTADYDGLLPSSVLYDESKTWDEDDFCSFASLRGVIPDPIDANDQLTGKSWPMLVPHAKDIVWCPSDKSRSEKPSSIVSYYWKAAVDYAWYQGFRKETDFPRPMDQIILYEHNAWHWGQQKYGLVDGVTINCCYLDGHAASKEIINSGYTSTENPPKPLPKSGIGEPAWFNSDYVTKRPINKKTARGRFWNPSECRDVLP